MIDPCDLSIPEAGILLRDGRLTARQLTEAVLARITARDARLRAFVHRAPDALDQADRADAMMARGDPGPFCGIPVAVKDLIDVAGMPATSGSAVLAGRVATIDAPAVARLRAQGAVILGKLATYEFAMVGPDMGLPDPPARNPWNVAHVTGGSSSGSAAAVAGGLVRMALGTDTGGSVRSPAAYCGCVGLKPSRDRIASAGTHPLSPTLDHTGPLAATVAEAALALDAMTEDAAAWRPVAARLARGCAGLRIGYARDWFAEDPQAALALVRVMDDAAAHLSMLGALIRPVVLPDYALMEATGSVILHAEALAGHRDLLRDHARLYGAPAIRSLAAGAALDAHDLLQARLAQARLTTALLAAMAPFDLLLTATTLTTAPRLNGDAAVWTAMRTIPFNLTGQPALSLPAGFDGGLPLGMQLIGRIGDDDIVCATGHAFEAATDHAAQRPAF